MLKVLAPVLAAVALLAALPAHAADPAATCGTQACRKGGFKIAVRSDDKAFTAIPVVRSPYVLPNGSITIYPGETIAVQFTLTGDKLSAPKFVKAFAPRLPAQVSANGKLSDNPDNAALTKDDAATLPPNTILLSYGQFKGQGGMVLELEHNMPKTVKVDAIMAVIQAGSYVQKPASTCPIRPKLVGFETWPQALGPMMLANTRFAADGDTTCR
jgi:hypothetical protein